MSLFKISKINATASSVGTDGCKFTTSKEVVAVESQALKLESGKKDTSPENLQQTLSKILPKTVGMKQQDKRYKEQP